MRARALLNANIDPRVGVGEHGWWQAAPETNAPGYDPFSPRGSNYNLTVDPSARDPISGTTVPHQWPTATQTVADSARSLQRRLSPQPQRLLVSQPSAV
jgi:hypothetical protein